MDTISCWPPNDDSEEDNGQAQVTVIPEPAQKKAKLNHKESNLRESLAPVLLAKWWKNQTLLRQKANLHPTCNPNTMINLISRLPEAQEYLIFEVGRLRNRLLSCESGDSQCHAALASIHEILGEPEIALMHTDSLIKSSKTDEAPKHCSVFVSVCVFSLNPEKEHVVMHERLQRQVDVKMKQNALYRNLNSSVPLQFPQSRLVDVRDVNEFSFQDFFFNYALTSTPVVITGMQNILTKVPWNLQHIKNVAGDCVFTSKRHVRESVEWARLEDDRPIKVVDFIDSLSAQSDLPLSEQRYLFDWSLPIYCQSLAEEITIPKYFANDFLLRTAEGSLYRDSWPSLFIAPRGLCSELHVDAFGSNFWMALFQGRKKWQFFDKEDTTKLYPSYSQSLDPVFEVNLDDPNLLEYPLLSLSTPVEVILEPGQVLFVPAGCPHRVSNLDQTLAISSNFVDLSNMEGVKKELGINQWTNDRAKDLLEQLVSPSFCMKLNGNIDHTQWTDLHSQSNYSECNY